VGFKDDSFEIVDLNKVYENNIPLGVYS